VAKEPDAVRRMIGVIPQALTSDPTSPSKRTSASTPSSTACPRPSAKRTSTEVLEAVDLSSGAARRPRRSPAECAAGLRLPAAWSTIRSIFFLDEPTTGLDPVSRIAVWEMLNNLRSTRNLTMLITTHYMEEADKLCDRIAIVDHGKLVALGTPIELKHSVPGANVVEVHFDRETPEWQARLEKLEGVTSVQAESAGFYRVLTSSGSRPPCSWSSWPHRWARR
jgi:ABC-2 type transport system ATP-binding protein